MTLDPETERRAILAAHMSALTRTEGWDAYSDEVRAMRQRILDLLLLDGQEDKFAYHKGFIAGLDAALALPHHLRQKPA